MFCESIGQGDAGRGGAVILLFVFFYLKFLIRDTMTQKSKKWSLTMIDPLSFDSRNDFHADMSF